MNKQRVVAIVAWHNGHEWLLSSWSGKVHDIWVRLPDDASPFDAEAVLEWQHNPPAPEQAGQWERVRAFLSDDL